MLRLCHLVSPALPLGAYAYSQGLEYAVHAGWVRDEATTLEWLQGLSRSGLGSLGDDAIGVSSLSQVLASALHESQYTRLFRS